MDDMNLNSTNDIVGGGSDCTDANGNCSYVLKYRLECNFSGSADGIIPLLTQQL